MADSFLFEAVRLDDEAPSIAAFDAGLSAVAAAAGWQAEGPPDSVDLRHGDLLAGVHRFTSPERWTVSTPDADLRWADGTPDAAGQTAVIDLLRALLELAPPYVGVSCWPFGPTVPEVYDTSTPFALREVGSVTYVSDRYRECHLSGIDIEAAPTARQERLPDGVLLIADDLLRSAADGQLDDLRRFLGLPPAGPDRRS